MFRAKTKEEETNKNMLYSYFYIVLPFYFPQWVDIDHPAWHHQHAAVSQHGQVLEGAARDLRHAQTRRGAPQVVPVQTSRPHRRHGLSTLGATQEAQDEQEAMRHLWHMMADVGHSPDLEHTSHSGVRPK